MRKIAALAKSKLKETQQKLSLKLKTVQERNFYNQLKKGKLLQNQLRNPQSIPILIINYNQLFFLKQLVEFLIKRNFENIIIIDNCSDYAPLLQYYQEIKNRVTIEKMSENLGHKVFFKTKSLQEQYGKGYFVITDADIVPNENLPEDFLTEMLNLLNTHFDRITKVGFALDLESIPDFFPLKEKVLKHEAKFWKNSFSKDLYFANIDTTFALYKPYYPQKFTTLPRLAGIRMAGNFTAKHGGWYIDPNNYTEENLHYIQSVDKSGSWKLNEKGEHDNKGIVKY